MSAVNLDGTVRGNVVPAVGTLYDLGTTSEKFRNAHFSGTVNGNVVGNLTGDVTGSVFADDSTLLVDAVNGEIPGYISITSLKTEVAASADFAAFKTRIAAL